MGFNKMNNYCSNCKKDIESEVYTYSMNKFGKALCRSCQNNKNSFDYNMIKGRIAEALIEQLFIKLGYRVYRYGMENTIPGIMELLGQVKTEVSNIIKRMPDFVIQDKSGIAHFVEVKFRSDESFSLEDLKEEKLGRYPFPNAYFVIVSKKHIKCLSYEQLLDGKKITPSCHNYLGNVKSFETDKDIIIEFCEYAVKFFDGV